MTNPLEAKSAIPTFTTKRLYLRPVNKADIPAYTRYFVDYEVIRHLSAAVPWPYPENGVADYILNRLLPQQGHDRWAWAITMQATLKHSQFYGRTKFLQSVREFSAKINSQRRQHAHGAPVNKQK